ncbi:MAG TPA: prepilin-type N-terminal cleavage/methylation domain-containing protein [Gemmatimonadaceae bacterium]|jgi:prepilin-type N-terminal cleavage/methylation domain-containing protein|nr:prepilin-type N-terminal cleavage/methylation domain-containing protein [Gemmatimonadaceae bacterium]
MSEIAASRGYTLLEIVVALVVFGCGALALAGSSALVARSMGSDAVRERAARIAVSRVEILKSECETAQGGSELVEGIRSEWRVSRDPSRITIEESLGFSSVDGPRTLIYKSLYWCVL